MEATPASESDHASMYDATYYQLHCGPHPYERNALWTSFFGMVADTIVRIARPRTVIDVGCAFGFLVEALWDRNVQASGFDISPTAIENVRADVRAYCGVGSILTPRAERYDAACCFEVLEHLPPEETDAAIENLTALSDLLIFSSSPTDLTEPTHINVRPTLAWITAFAEHGFAPDPHIDMSGIAPHAFALRRATGPIDPDFLYTFAEIVRSRMDAAEKARLLDEERTAGHNQRRLHEDQIRNAQSELQYERGRVATLDEHRKAAVADRERLGLALDREQMHVAELGGQRDEALERIIALERERDRATREMEAVATMLEGEHAELRRQIHETELTTHFVVSGKFWRLKRLASALRGRSF